MKQTANSESYQEDLELKVYELDSLIQNFEKNPCAGISDDTHKKGCLHCCIGSWQRSF